MRRLFLHSSAARASGLTDQVVALGDVRGPTGGIRVRRGGGCSGHTRSASGSADAH